MILGLVASVVLAHGSLVKAICMIILGLLLGLVGTDVTSGLSRFTFDLPDIAEGISFVAVAMGPSAWGKLSVILSMRRDIPGRRGFTAWAV